MISKTCLTMAALAAYGLAATAQAQSAPTPDFEYHGYLRSGIGASRGGTDQEVFRAPEASAKFRLGNENETYGEMSFVKNTVAGKGASAPLFSTHLLFAVVSAGRHDWESTSATYNKTTSENSQDLTIAMREAYVQAKGVLGAAQPWVGKRFYRRQDIHILDYYVIANAGPGFGVEGIPVGFANLQTAVTRNTPSSGDAPAQTNIDLRLSDIALGGAGKLEILAIQGSSGKRGHDTAKADFESMSGTQLGVVHNMDVLGGFNRVTLQYGLGLFGGVAAVNETTGAVSRSETLGNFGDNGNQAIKKGDSKTRDARKKSSTMRVAEELVGQFGKTASVAAVLLYQATDFGGVKDSAGKTLPKKTELMVGARPVLNLNDYSSVAFEAGLVKVSDAGVNAKTGKSADATLTKLTLAPQITAGDTFWARPALRLFATYAKWNDEAKGKVGGDTYVASTAGFSTGAQVEAWW